MEYEPEGLDADQMQRFENQIDAWIAKYEGTLPTASDFRIKQVKNSVLSRN